MSDPRPGWDEYFLGIAEAVSRRADCTRRQVGVVIVDQDHRIVSTGYNGAPAGLQGCLSDRACPRGRHKLLEFHPFDDRHGKLCLCGGPWPCEEAVEPGSSYDTGPGVCISLHAELNAVVYAGRSACHGATMYLTDMPCDGCRKAIAAAGILAVKWPHPSGRGHVTGYTTRPVHS